MFGFIEYIIAGVLQGIFEWLPVSSEGVVSLFSDFSLEQANNVDFALFTSGNCLGGYDLFLERY